MLKKSISILLAILMCVTFIMPTVFAEEENAGDAGNAEFPNVYPSDRIIKLSDLEIEQRVEALIRTMTVEEKYAMLGGSGTRASDYGFGTGIVVGVPRLGVPLLRMWDGPNSVIGPGTYETTIPASELAVASTFDTDLAYRFGEVIGKENKATGGNVQLGVQLDQVRSPYFQRSRDTFGEDAYLTGAIGLAAAKGVEAHNVINTLKHLTAYSYQFTRTDDNFIVDEQTLHEAMLSPYEMIVKAGVAHGIMASYNLVNGTQTNESNYLLNNVLRTMWGFEGLTMTDWAACKKVTTANGLDLEMGSISKNNRQNIESEIEAGNMTFEDVNNAVRHVLTAYGKAGYLGLVEVKQNGMAVEDLTPPRCIELELLEGEERQALLAADNEIALETALKGAVLLKNENNALPIKSGDVAMLGITGSYTLTGHYRETAFGWLQPKTSPYENMTEIYKGGNVYNEEVYDMAYDTIPASALFTDAEGTTNGVVMEKGDTVTVLPTAELTTGTIDGKVNRTYKNSADGNALVNGESATLTTYVKPDETGEYRFKLSGIGGRRTLSVEGGDRTLTHNSNGFATTGLVCTAEGMDIPSVPHVNNVPGEAQPTVAAYDVVANLESGKLYKVTITVQASQATKDAQVRLSWQPPSKPAADYANGINLAKKCDTVVIFAHDCSDNLHNYRQRRTLALAGDQIKLIQDAAKAAKENGNKVVVVLNIAIPVTMDWLDDVDAVLNMWLPGQAGGLATAQLLTGAVNPSGKLSVTFPKADADTQHGDAMVGEMSAEDTSRLLNVTEGIFSGYRWYDSDLTDAEPLFDFGYGLSYTSFEYSNMKAEMAPNSSVDVTFTVKNTGTVKGSEVAQVYLGAAEVPEGIQMANYALAGFYRLNDLEPGESRTVTVNVDERQLSYWNATTKVGIDNVEDLVDVNNTVEKWTLAEGTRTVYVGSSSDDLRLSQEVDVQRTSDVVVQAPASTTANENFTVTITTGTDVIGLKLYNEKGSSITIKSMSKNKQGDKVVWTLITAIGTAGDNREISVYTKTLEDGYADSGSKININIKAAPVEVKSVAFDRETAGVNEAVQANVVTSSSAKSINVTNEKGLKMGKTLVSKTTGVDGDITWVYSMKFGSKGYGKIYTFAAAGADGVFGAKTAKTYIDIV